MAENHISFSKDQISKVEQALADAGFLLEYDQEKHRIEIGREVNGPKAHFRLPIDYQPGQGQVATQYLMLLVQSGSASIGVFENEKCLAHKVFSAYMVRKKQGKSQIKHLKTKGKSRAGSRVRLASTLEFFENINTRLTNHCQEYAFDRIAMSCSKILLPYLFGSKVPTPFDKKDPRIYRIPKHLHQPNYEVMLGMHRFLMRGELIFDEAHFPELKALQSC